ncbi:unnamed protein product [Trichogramma brassicae]|uniref:Splicing factor U2af 38 kDa subunit n=1 Tax=Trichogramma brassicae TaxID=86971 RepID=A0A6H5HZQ7_9HYME|nr:unnamed protein product [Trichogramma brassicae]
MSSRVSIMDENGLFIEGKKSQVKFDSSVITFHVVERVFSRVLSFQALPRIAASGSLAGAFGGGRAYRRFRARCSFFCRQQKRAFGAGRASQRFRASSMRVHRQRCETEETPRAQLKRIPRFPTSLCTEQKLRCEPRESKMAEYLASIFGTEKDKVNCSFYFKIGACRHGDRCSRIHNKPTFSQTCLLQNLYVNPQNSAKSADGSHLVANVSDEEMQEHYDNFFEDVFVECEDKYGEIEEMNVCDNLGDHLVGNVYIKFRREEDAEKAVNDLNNRCECTRSGFCNFMHLKPISRDLRRYLYSRKKGGGGGRGGGRSRSRSRSPKRDRKRRSRSRDRRSRSKDRRKDQNDVRARGIPAVYACVSHHACKETHASGGKITRDSEGGGGANSTIALLRVIFESAKKAISVQVVPVHAWLLLVVGAIDDLEAFVLFLLSVEYFSNGSLDQGNRHPILGQLYTLAQELDAIAEGFDLYLTKLLLLRRNVKIRKPAYLLDAHVTDTLRVKIGDIRAHGFVKNPLGPTFMDLQGLKVGFSCSQLILLVTLLFWEKLKKGVGSIPTRRIFEVRFFAWCGRACARGGAGTTQKEDPGYVISLRSGKKTPITVRAGSDRITISRSPRRGLTRLAIDGAQHSHDEVRSENHTHKRAPDAGAKAQQERMMAPEARTTLTR